MKTKSEDQMNDFKSNNFYGKSMTQNEFEVLVQSTDLKGPILRNTCKGQVRVPGCKWSLFTIVMSMRLHSRAWIMTCIIALPLGLYLEGTRLDIKLQNRCKITT
jgi:hypothetical protein